MPTLKVWDGSAWVEVKGDKGDPGEVTNADLESRVTPVEDRVATVEDTTSAMAADVEKVAPPEAGVSGDELRVSGGQPRWLPPNAVSPFDFGGVADGTTDDYSAIMQAYARLGSRGGTIDLGGRQWYSAQTIELKNATKLTGGQGGHQNGGRARAAEIVFPRGITGIRLAWGGEFGHSIEHLGLSTAGAFEVVPTGPGDGIEVHVQEVNIDNVNIRGFGRDGIHVESGVGGSLSNFGQLNQVRSTYNGRHGMYWEGAGSNVWTVIGANVSFNRGYGIYNAARYQHVFLAPHGSGNFEGDFFDDGRSNVWETPYSESEGKFVIGPNSHGCILLLGGHGAPSLWYGTTPTENFTIPANARQWVIIRAGEYVSDLRIGDGSTDHSGPAHWRFRRGIPSADNVQVYDDVTAKTPFRWSPTSFLTTADATHIAAAAGSRAGFFGKSPVTQRSLPAAATDAASTQALANALRQALIDLGIAV